MAKQWVSRMSSTRDGRPVCSPDTEQWESDVDLPATSLNVPWRLWSAFRARMPTRIGIYRPGRSGTLDGLTGRLVPLREISHAEKQGSQPRRTLFSKTMHVPVATG